MIFEREGTVMPVWQIPRVDPATSTSSHHERQLHSGFASYWYYGHDLLLDRFTAFSNESPDRNSVDFIYWFSGEGMAEFLIEMDRQKLSLRKFQKQESLGQKKTEVRPLGRSPRPRPGRPLGERRVSGAGPASADCA